MWFKNLRLYRLTEAFKTSPEELNEKLGEHVFNPCGKLDLKRQGFVPPLGRHSDLLVHAIPGYIMVALKRQEKILPGGVVREALEEKVQQISEQEGRRVSRKERDGLKDELIFELLPKAFVKNATDFAYIAPVQGYIVVNAGSAGRAEELLSALREALGSLPCIPVSAKTPVPQVLTRWLLEQPEAGFELGEECELKAAKDERVVRCKKQDLTADEVLSHIHTGMVVSKLAFNWKDTITGVIEEDLAIKRLRFGDEIKDKAADAHPETAAEEFDTEFAVMTLEMKSFIEALAQAFGFAEA
ncbi:MAG TPA: recombination-associated protein RdgC [Marinagarivorans sp.]